MNEKEKKDKRGVFYVLKCKKVNGDIAEIQVFPRARDAVSCAKSLADDPTYEDHDQFVVYPAWIHEGKTERTEFSPRATMSVWSLRGRYPSSSQGRGSRV